MQINRIQSQNINKGNNISHKGAREVVRTLANPDALLSTVLLEGAVTGGRGYNAYKRGGKNEFRERFLDDVLSAIFWLKGIDMCNKVGDVIGAKLLKLPTTEFDVGEDALRKPFKNLISDLSIKCTDKDKLKSLEKKLATFKFTKIVLSTFIATGFVGFALPKINQAITRKLFHKEKTKKSEQTSQKENSTKYSSVNFLTMKDFEKKITNNNKPSFKSAITTFAHLLENNKVCKLLSTDTGILSGRMVTSRNKDEALEYLFRDSASSFFYLASTPLIYSGLQKLSGSKGLTSIDPVAAKEVNNLLLTQLQNGDMSVEEFSKKAIGVVTDDAEEILKKISFKDGVTSFDDLMQHITDEGKLKKALKMAELQPELAGVGKVLTRQQVVDVLKDGVINDAEFMKKVYTSKFGDALTNPYKFISMKKITDFRDNIDDYVQSIIKVANKNNNGKVTKELLNNINKKSFMMSAGFRAVAMGISAFALGVAIPKIQYAITAKRTGSNSAPGLREFEQQKA